MSNLSAIPKLLERLATASSTQVLLPSVGPPSSPPPLDLPETALANLINDIVASSASRCLPPLTISGAARQLFASNLSTEGQATTRACGNGDTRLGHRSAIDTRTSGERLDKRPRLQHHPTRAALQGIRRGHAITAQALNCPDSYLLMVQCTRNSKLCPAVAGGRHAGVETSAPPHPNPPGGAIHQGAALSAGLSIGPVSQSARATTPGTNHPSRLSARVCPSEAYCL
ncbi:unnamed protein product [Lampetra planeri]